MTTQEKAPSDFTQARLEPLMILLACELGEPHPSSKVGMEYNGGGMPSIEDASYALVLHEFGLLRHVAVFSGKSAGALQVMFLANPTHGLRLYWHLAKNQYVCLKTCAALKKWLGKSFGEIGKNAVNLAQIELFHLLDSIGANQPPPTDLLRRVPYYVLQAVWLTQHRPPLDNERLAQGLERIRPDLQKLLEYPAELYIALTDATDGKQVVLDLRKMIETMDEQLILQYGVASCTIPGPSKPALVDGKLYTDGGLSSSCVDVTLAKRCTHTIAPINKTMRTLRLTGPARGVVVGHATRFNPNANVCFTANEERIVAEVREIKATHHATDPNTGHRARVLLSHPTNEEGTAPRTTVDTLELRKLGRRGRARIMTEITAAKGLLKVGFVHSGWTPQSTPPEWAPPSMAPVSAHPV